MNRRLLILTAVLAGLVALNVLEETPASVAEVVAPVARHAAALLPTQPASAVGALHDRAMQSGLPVAIDTDPFAGLPPTPIPKPIVVPIMKATPVPTPPPPPPPPPEPAPPLSVIGYWLEEGQGHVLISGPSGVTRARPGEVVFAEYMVEQVQSGRVTLRRQRDERRIELVAPALPPGMTAQSLPAPRTTPQKAPVTAQAPQGEKD